MADGTPIEWTDATWNPITGCSVHSAGCKRCYAMLLAGTRLQHHPSRAGLTVETKAGPVWTGEVRFNEQWLTEPLRWTKPRRIFVVAHGDLFHEAVPDEWIDRVFAVMALCPQHQFQVLTKRAARMRDYFLKALTSGHLLGGRLQRIQDAAYRLMATMGGGWDEARGSAARSAVIAALKRIDDRTNAGFANVWLGVSVEDQRAADERIPHLLATPAAIRWISAEPLLGPIDLNSSLGGTRWIGGQRGCAGSPERSGAMHHGSGSPDCPRHLHHHHDDRCQPGLDWVVGGGENGDRPSHPQWFRDMRDQCAAAGVPFLFKQWGSFLPDNQESKAHPYGSQFGKTPAGKFADGLAYWAVGKKAAGRLLDGHQHDGFPA